MNSLPAFVHLKGADFKSALPIAGSRNFGNPGNKPCYELMLGRSESCEDCHSLEVLKTKVPQKFEWSNADNTRTYEVYHYPFCDDHSLLVLTLGIDITERKRAEAGVREREEQLHTIYENAPLIMMLVDAERRVCKANKMAAAMCRR